MSFAEEMIRDWRVKTVGARRRLADASGVSEDEVERLLVEQGVIRLSEDPPHAQPRRELIQVTGKPVSEMIIEERR
jgi:hypothetical protein